ncbi:ferritin-like domain-containing protein [Amylocarpus encephaloides]|uniref:Ferritin-like domain-containing protein n=1 Tax=Amylocarpus encephaloides TaxID=45428 RepID=A0A9P7YG73_9HELO|nr:ferritin-like domain-containing protein [Amylocarpus encephaloides]
MKYQISIAALAAAGIVSAGPVLSKRALTDIDILNYALTLEHLEATFYRQGLANYTQAQFVAAGFPDPFYANLQEIAYDETTHVSFLTKALGTAATAECIYTFPSTDPKSFVALAGVLEGVGVSAYLGAAASIAMPDYLTAAGSILTVEARHSAYIRSSQAQSPFPSPFDAPLSPNSVYTLAAPFISSCPSTNPALPVKAFPTLTLATAGPIASGTEITLMTPGYDIRSGDPEGKIYAAFVTVTGGVFAQATKIEGGFTVVVPKGVNGQVYVVLSGCAEGPVTDENVGAGPAILEITNPYPTMA